MKKGDIVLAKAKVKTGYYTPDGATLIHEPKSKYKRKKSLFRYSFLLYPVRGIISGWTHRATGYYESSTEDDPPTLYEDKRHKVWLVQPFNKNHRWEKPLACLEEDLEIVEGDNTK